MDKSGHANPTLSDPVNIHGLTEIQARERQQAEGRNELAASGSRGISAIVLEVIREPMFLRCWWPGGIYLLLGDAAMHSCCSSLCSL